MKTLLVTGGAGFIGSNFIKFIMKNHPNCYVINLDLLTYAGNLENLIGVEASKNYMFIRGDIADAFLVNRIFETYKPCGVINFAAETHVDRSISDPGIFLKTNVLGTNVLLDAARKCWKDNEETCYKFVQVSTDEVYGALGENGRFSEETPLMPSSPYSASKAASDMLTRAYHVTYGLPINITRCSNNYGPNQFPEKLIPLVINNCLNGEKIPIYGDGCQVRDWLHVEDHCSAIAAVYFRGKVGQSYNIGGNAEKKNIDLVKLIIEIVNKNNGVDLVDSKLINRLITFVEDRPGHDKRYAIDNTKISSELSWAPKFSFEQGINETVMWYLNNQQWLNNVINSEYRSYYDRQYKTKL